MASFKALVITGEGDSETIQAACRTISQMLAGFGGNGSAPAVEPAAPAIESAPVRRITRKPRRTKAERYERPPDEPDGFSSSPKPSTPTFVKNAKANEAVRGAAAGGGLAGRIVQALDDLGGCAPVEAILRKLGPGKTAQGVKLAASKCPQLKRVGDDRVALVNWEQDDE